MSACWPAKDSQMITYHDEEWGVPVHDDRKWFEFIVLDAFQAGLSWSTVLRKRKNFRIAFDDFDFELIARYGEQKILDLQQDTGIIRNRLKIQSTVSNAQAFIRIRQEFCTFDAYLWGFTEGKVIDNGLKNLSEMPARSPLSDQISKDMTRRGFRFAGSTIVYAFLQAAGVVNDHLVTCPRYRELGGRS